MTPTMPKEGTQEYRVLRELLDADGGTLYSDYFIRVLYLTQFHRALHNIEHKHHWKVERMPRNVHGFYGYRILQDTTQLALSM